MHKRRWIIEAELELLTPLHIGSGESAPDKRLPRPEGEKEHPEVAKIIRDHENKPWIPPTSVKGLLRNAARQVLADVAFARIFGEIKDNEQGRMARLTAYGMEMMDWPESCDLPYYEKGVFISAHTAMDPATGTVDEHKLYHREMVAPGAIFYLRLALAVDEEHEEQDLELLGRLLAAFENGEGIGFGRGRQDGNGRMCLYLYKKPILRLCELGELVEARIHKDWPEAFKKGWRKGFSPSGKVWKLKLTPDKFSGPFLVADPSQRQSDGESSNRVSALRKDQSTPHLPGESFMGALKARAQWLVALKDLRGENPGDIMDVLFGTAAKGEQKATRGKLGLVMLKVEAEQALTLPSVALDRFSSAPLDQALFEVEGFIGTKIEATLRLETNDAAAEQFMEELIADLRENGLTLGHGEARGFGWFSVEEVKGEEVYDA
jgi:CRISPR/Cas system CMR subunit Cmr4 (Cas7 group RAMP superfamily)